MAILPRCTFDVRIPEGHLVAGGPVEMLLVVDSSEPLPRAKRILCRLEIAAKLEGGKSPSLPMVEHDVELPLPNGLPKGPYELPLTFPTLPDWLPPTFEVGRPVFVACSVTVRVDVTWARDPTAHFSFPVVVPPRPGVRSPVIKRSAEDFHRSASFEVTLASNVVRQDEPIEGAIAINESENARFDAVQIEVVSVLSLPLDHRPEPYTDRSPVASLFLSSEKLRNGRAVPFSLRPKGLLASFDNPYVRHKVYLVVQAEIPRPPHPGCARTTGTLRSPSKFCRAARTSRALRKRRTSAKIASSASRPPSPRRRTSARQLLPPSWKARKSVSAFGSSTSSSARPSASRRSWLIRI